jgi:tetratricopeptide (TPR) repeat protein
MLDAFDLYLTFVTNKDTNDDQMVRMKYQRARLYYEYNHFDKAAPLFAEIADKHPKHEVGPISANLLIDCLNIMARTDALARSSDRFLASPDLMRDQDLKRVCAEQKGSVKWVKADAEKRAGRYKNAGKLFLETFNDNPHGPKAVQVLYNAALMYDAARLVGQAIRVRQNLIKLFPNTPEAQKALYQIAENFQGIALYERAAENFESFAIKYPGEKESAEALGNATFFPRGLGQDDKAIKDNGDFIRFYGQRKPAEAAGVFFSIGDIYAREKKWDQVVRHYPEFLSRYGSTRPDLQVVAHVRMGEILWRQSCPVGDGVNGACEKLERVQAGGAASDQVNLTKGKQMGVKSRTQCGPETKSKITLVTRNETKAHEAQKHFAAALAVYQSHAGNVSGANEAERAERTEITNDAAAHARFMQGEVLFEKMLSIPFPDQLAFSSNPALKRQDTESKRRFATWLKEKQRILESARAVYLDVLPFKQAHWTIASSARVGQLFQNLADGLYTAPIPSPAQLITDLKKMGATAAQIQEYVGQFREHFCDQLVDRTRLRWLRR